METKLDKELKYHEIERRISSYMKKLHDSDYIASKLAEAIAEYLVIDNGDKSKLVAIYNEYQETIKNKQAWRDEINSLEEELKAVKE